jgi:hypothetical protein
VRARLARVLLFVALLAGWQAALEHSVEHGTDSHQESSFCDALTGLTACAAETRVLWARHCPQYEVPFHPLTALRAAEAPPFLSHAPPASV